MDPTLFYMQSTLYSAITNTHMQTQDLNQVKTIFGKVLSQPRDPRLKDGFARIDQVVQDQLDYLHALYNNPIEEDSRYTKTQYQQAMRSAFTTAMENLERTTNNMLAHAKGESQASMLFMKAAQPAAANPIRPFVNIYHAAATIDSVGQVSNPPKALLSAKPAAAEPPIAKVAAQEKNEIDDEDEDMVCPIRGEVMKDPYVDPEGNSYEKSAILEWLGINKSSPITRKPLTAEQLVPNRALKKLIDKKYSK